MSVLVKGRALCVCVCASPVSKDVGFAVFVAISAGGQPREQSIAGCPTKRAMPRLILGLINPAHLLVVQAFAASV